MKLIDNEVKVGEDGVSMLHMTVALPVSTVVDIETGALGKYEEVIHKTGKDFLYCLHLATVPHTVDIPESESVPTTKSTCLCRCHTSPVKLIHMIACC